MLLAIDKYFNKLASQERSLKPRRINLPSSHRNCNGHLDYNSNIENNDPRMVVREEIWDGGESSRTEVSPTPRQRRWLLIDEYFDNCLEKEAQSKHIPNHFHAKVFSDPKKRHRLLVDEYLDNRREKLAQSEPIRSRPLPKKSHRLLIDEYLDNRLEREAHPNLIRNRSLTKLQEAQMPRKKREPEVVRVYADAAPRRARVYVDGLSHALKDYAKANNLPVVEAIAAKLKWFMRFEDSLENFFVHGKADQHPDFNEYFSALMAQPHFRNLCGDEAASILKQEFSPKANPLMPNGYSCWASYNREPYPENPRRSVA